ncbi:MAG: type II toxin-antitoxin system VapC family toxin [Alphaproteobacteria bacterium]|nr:type II toxin-antitoxin system VapC family toxin [Alphaproteobacteria bacterium]MCW5744052.1 type II toxin-antitoxin system VapC family toxin [Alphaproteobacteria bacterium]
MKLLVDTHLLLRAAGEPQKLSPAARRLLDDTANELWFSAASLWEVAVRQAAGRADLRVEPRRLRRELIAHGWQELAITSEHAAAAGDLPPTLKDPFDRMLLAQAAAEGLMLVTMDPAVARQSGRVRQV